MTDPFEEFAPRDRDEPDPDFPTSGDGEDDYEYGGNPIPAEAPDHNETRLLTDDELETDPENGTDD